MPIEISNEKTFEAIDLLNEIGDALLKYKALPSGKLYSVKTTLEFPKDVFDRFILEAKKSFGKTCLSDENNFMYAGFKFGVKILN